MSETKQPPRQSAFEFLDKMADIRAELARQVFHMGVWMLTASGSTEPSARSFLGKRMKEIGKPALLRAIIAAILNEVADPRAYIAAAGRVAPGRHTQRADDADQPDDSAGIQPWMG